MPVLYVYFAPDNGDSYPGVPARDITDADWAGFSPSQKRTVIHALSDGERVWLPFAEVDETEQERADREAAEQAARDAFVRGNSVVRYRDMEAAIAAIEPGTGSGIETTVTNAVGEWWIYPLATFQQQPYPRTVFGAIATNGDILACEFNHGSGTTRRYKVSSGKADDHNVPALWVKGGHRPVIAWSQHSTDNVLRICIGSKSNDLASLSSASLQAVDLGSGVSYAQMHHIDHLSDATQDTFWVFTRLSLTGWNLVPIHVNQTTGAVTSETPQPIWSGGQGYVTTSPGNDATGQTIRFAIGMNPADDSHEIYVGQIDCVTGDITLVGDDAFAANVSGTNLPMGQNRTAMIPDSAAGRSRRLFYVRPGPDQIAVSYADWEQAAPDDATYKVGMIDSIPGYMTPANNAVTTPYHASLADTNGYTFTTILTLPAAEPAQTFTFARMSDGYTGTNGWMLDITAAKTFRMFLFTSTGSVNHAMPLPANWGDTIGLRFAVDMSTMKARRYWSPNPFASSPTWLELGSGAGVTLTGTLPYSATQPLIVGHSSIPKLYMWELRNAAGTKVAGVDVRTEWTSGNATFTDTAGRLWTLGAGSVIVPGQNGLVETPLGIAGPRIGYTEGANYIAGIAFENPSHDGAVVRARSASGTETVDRIVGTQTETLMTQPTTDGRLIRPYPPVNGGPFRAIVTDMTSYHPESYTQYSGKVRGLA